MKKLLCMMLALLFAASVASAEVWPASEEKLSVTIAVIGQQSGEYDTDNMWITNYWREVANLDINWMNIDTAVANEKIVLLLGGGDMPDAIMGYKGFSNALITKYGVEEGILYNFNDLLDSMPSFSALLEAKPNVRAALTASDGGIYGLPRLADGDYSFPLRFFINAEWLEKADLEMPTTLDEFYQALCAFRDNDMDGDGDATNEIPFSGAWSEGYSERAWMLNAFGFSTSSSNTALYYDENDQASPAYIPYTAQYKEYLLYMNKLWNEGLLDLDMFTQTDAQVSTKFTEGRVGFLSCAAPGAVDATKEFIYDAAHVLTSDPSRPYVYPQNSAVNGYGMFVINAQCEEKIARALAKFADSFYNEYTYSLYQNGPTYSEAAVAPDAELGSLFNTEYGVYYNTEKNALDWIYPTDQYSSNWTWRCTSMSFWSLPGYVCDGNVAWQVEFAKKYPETALGQLYGALDYQVQYNHWKSQTIDAQCAYYHAMLPDFFYSEDDQTAVTDLSMVLDDYVANMEARFITSDLSIEENWDSFQSTLESYGVKDYLDILNRYWAEYNK